jgi:hypothetical protein
VDTLDRLSEGFSGIWDVIGDNSDGDDGVVGRSSADRDPVRRVTLDSFLLVLRRTVRFGVDGPASGFSDVVSDS